jgi:hypothetical protein
VKKIAGFIVLESLTGLGLIVQIFATFAGFIVLCRICFNSENQQKTHRNLLIAFLVFSILSFVTSMITVCLIDEGDGALSAGLWSLLFSIRIVFLLFSTSSDQFQSYPKKNEIFTSLLIWSFLNCTIILAEVILKIIGAVAWIRSWHEDEVALVSISAVFSFAQLIITSMICYSAYEHYTIQESWISSRISSFYANMCSNLKLIMECDMEKKSNKWDQLNSDDCNQPTVINNQDQIKKDEEMNSGTVSDTEPLLP